MGQSSDPHHFGYFAKPASSLAKSIHFPSESLRTQYQKKSFEMSQFNGAFLGGLAVKANQFQIDVCSRLNQIGY